MELHAQSREIHREMFLARLRRLVAMECDLGPRPTDGARRMLEQALSSTYWDCCQLGARADARAILGLADH